MRVTVQCVDHHRVVALHMAHAAGGNVNDERVDVPIVFVANLKKQRAAAVGARNGEEVSEPWIVDGCHQPRAVLRGIVHENGVAHVPGCNASNLSEDMPVGIRSNHRWHARERTLACHDERAQIVGPCHRFTGSDKDLVPESKLNGRSHCPRSEAVAHDGWVLWRLRPHATTKSDESIYFEISSRLLVVCITCAAWLFWKKVAVRASSVAASCPFRYSVFLLPSGVCVPSAAKKTS